MRIAAREIAQLLGGTIEGDAEVFVSRPGKIEEGGEETLTFLANPRYEHYAYEVPSAVLIAGRDFHPTQPVAARAIIRVPDVYEAVRQLLQHFDARPSNGKAGISERSSVHPQAKVEAGACVGEFCVIEAGAYIGEGTQLVAQVYVGENVRIGRNCLIYPGVRIYRDVEIGDNCIIHANAVIGSDGFGYALQPDGSYRKIPQIGKVLIEDDVEIGANTTIDRATMDATIIRRGAKLDNLVMVAHNVEIGAHTAVAAQAGFAGSTRIGNHCRIGGQSGFVGHIHVADKTSVQAQSGVASSIDTPGTAVYGSPALPYGQYLRSYALFKRLPELFKRLLALEKKLNDATSSSDNSQP
ncbi:MAG: UDP-3-O-acylglucosamine N-acyltransferase [Saprospiraceae bacterium]|nr:MAG: UDP-3-O-acylglucosamine N-acyltransferase [Saprospiraceae bacterium]